MKITKLFQKVNNQILEIDIPNIEDLDKRYLSKNGGEINGNIVINNILTSADSYEYVRGSAKTDSGSNKALADLIFQNMDSTTKSAAILRAYNRINGTQYRDLRIDALDDGTFYASCPNPRGLYNTDIVNYQSMVDYGFNKISQETFLYLNATTGSDTADLNNGRGLLSDKPFKTMDGLLNWARNRYTGPSILTIILNSDIDWSPSWFVTPQVRSLTIKSDNTKRTINLSSPLTVYYGALGLYNLKLNATKSLGNILGVAGYYTFAVSSLYIFSTGIELSGTVTKGSIVSTTGGQVVLDGNIEGSVTGPRYYCEHGGRILTRGRGPNAIPGTEAGKCDDSSTYA